jgi:hypothetical protein
MEFQKKSAEWRRRGISPACLADSDKEKHFTKMCVDGEEYDILPLGAALEKYPGSRIFLSVRQGLYAEITDVLLARGIPSERI